MNALNDAAPVSIRFEDEIAVIRVDNPPVNALSHAVRKGIVECVGKAVTTDGVKVLLLVCGGRTFIAGADITEFGKPPQPPSLPEVVGILEDCPLPVVAALHGTALGGGFETALACRYRIALDSARVGLPEVSLGLIPGAGGTQRLPRLAGLKNALDMITSGRQVGAEEALGMGIIDRTSSNPDLLEAALDFCRELVAGGAARQPVSGVEMHDSPENEAILQEWRQRIAKKARGQESPLAAVESIGNAVRLPFTEGLEKEREIFQRLMASPQSKALRYIFFAERAAGILSESVKASAAEISTAAIIGGGTMGRGIAMCFANRGIPVTVLETDQQKLDQALKAIEKTYAGMVRSGRISETGKRRRLALISGGCEHASLAGADLVIEAAFEDLRVKQGIFSSLDEHCRDDAILATNTSYLDISAIAGAVRDPSRVVGMHFFSPAHIMKLLEVVRTPRSSDRSIASVMKLGKTLGKSTVLVGNGFGFAANRMYSAYGREGQQMLLEGVTPGQLDKAMQEWGMAMGPTAVLDLSGIDIGYNARKQNPNPPDDPCYFRPANLLAEKGYLGRKTGRGFYRYDPDTGAAAQDPEVIELIRNEARRLGVAQRRLGEAEIQQRMIRAIFTEGLSILQEGIAARSSDLDVIWVNGYGFPRWRGGPMHYGSEQGWSGS